MELENLKEGDVITYKYATGDETISFMAYVYSITKDEILLFDEINTTDLVVFAIDKVDVDQNISEIKVLGNITPIKEEIAKKFPEFFI